MVQLLTIARNNPDLLSVGNITNAQYLWWSTHEPLIWAPG